MAYILQHRRDTLTNWTSVNPVLADAEVGFILDLDENGVQKSSLYKIGDGRTSWNNLPLFGFGGNVYDDFRGNDLNTSVASRQAILNKINEIAQSTTDELTTEMVSGLATKLSNSQLVQMISPENGEYFGDLYNDPENPLTWDQMQPYLEKQIISRWALLQEFQQIWNDFGGMEDTINLANNEIETLKGVAEVFGEFKTTTEATLGEIAADLEAKEAKLSEHDEVLDTHTESIQEHEKFISGWDEIIEPEAPEDPEAEPVEPTIIRHAGVDEKFESVGVELEEVRSEIEAVEARLNNKHQILLETEFAQIKDFSIYPEGTLFYTYKAEA